MFSEKINLDYSVPKTLLIKLSDNWRISSGLPTEEKVISALFEHSDITQINFDISQLKEWDSGIVSFLLHLVRNCEKKNINVNLEGLPQGLQKLLSLALKIEEKEITEEIKESFFIRVGERTLQVIESIRSLLDFLGEIAVAFGRLILGKAYFRKSDFFPIVKKCGVDALFLVSLISTLVGVIFAFIGAIQLKLFGAQIYVADIVGIVMVRVMGAVMTGVLMSGRTGASFAAELGIMQTNEEIDALKTLGINPVEFLVMPRVIALVIMLPLLTIYADLMGIFGGYIISTFFLGLNPVEYLHHTQRAIKMNYIWIGLIHSFVFGIIVAVSGCLRGMKCKRSAAAVGEATTSAVVTAITCIVIATAIITFICQILGV